MGIAPELEDEIELLSKTITRQQDVINRLKPALILARDTMRHAQVFTWSREKMHPDGQALYKEALDIIETALNK